MRLNHHGNFKVQRFQLFEQIKKDDCAHLPLHRHALSFVHFLHHVPCLFVFLIVLTNFQVLFFNTSQKLKNRVGWLDDCPWSLTDPIWHSTPLCLHWWTICAIAFSFAIMFTIGWFAQCDGFLQCFWLLAASYETINHCPYREDLTYDWTELFIKNNGREKLLLYTASKTAEACAEFQLFTVTWRLMVNTA